MTRDVQNIRVESYDPQSFLMGDWRDLQAMEINAYGSGGFSKEEASALLFGDDLARYIQARKDPQSEVGRSLPDGLQVYQPHLIVAYRGEQFVGSLAAAMTVSGDPIKRALKRRFVPSRNYLWIKSLAVAEDERANGLAARMGSCLVRQMGNRIQNPVVAYVFPGNTPALTHKLLQCSFAEVGATRTSIIPGGEEHTMVRLESKRLAYAAAALGIAS